MYDYTKDSKAIEEIDEMEWFIYLTNQNLERKDFSKFETANIKENIRKAAFMS